MKENLLRALVISFLLAFILCWMASCGRNHWQKRGERKGWIETKIDTIVTDSVVTDTIFKHNLVKDTVILHKDKLTVKYFYNTTDSTVYLWGKCDPETIYVPTQTIKTVETESFLKKNWFAILCTFIIVFSFLYSRRK